MPTPLLKYSKEELLRLLQSSLAVRSMDVKEREVLNATIARSTDEQLIDLFAILRNERQFLDRTQEEFNEKFVKIMDDFVMKAKANVYQIKHKRANNIEKDNKNGERQIEEELLKQLKDV